jgi:flagellar biosynthetic protein FliR
MSPASFDPTAPGALSVLVLWALRVGGVLLVAPLFSARNIPAMLKAALLVLLAIVLLPAALAHTVEGARITAATFFSETLVGFAIGLGAAVFVGAAEVMGDVLALQTGLSSASVFDPLGQQSVSTLGQFTQLFALALLLTLNGHLVILEALAASTVAIPVGGALELERGLASMIALGGHLFSLGLRFAAPVVAVVLISNVALGILARVAPQLNVLMVAFPVQIGLGLFTLALSIPLIATAFTSWPTAYEAMLSTLLTALGR